MLAYSRTVATPFAACDHLGAWVIGIRRGWAVWRLAWWERKRFRCGPASYQPPLTLSLPTKPHAKLDRGRPLDVTNGARPSGKLVAARFTRNLLGKSSNVSGCYIHATLWNTMAFRKESHCADPATRVGSNPQLSAENESSYGN